MFGETTISHVRISNHPIETTIKIWLFGVPGISRCSRFFFEMPEAKVGPDDVRICPKIFPKKQRGKDFSLFFQVVYAGNHLYRHTWNSKQPVFSLMFLSTGWWSKSLTLKMGCFTISIHKKMGCFMLFHHFHPLKKHGSFRFIFIFGFFESLKYAVPAKSMGGTNNSLFTSWNPKQTVFSWMEMVISNHFLYKDLESSNWNILKQPFMNGCLGFQVHRHFYQLYIR